MKEKVIYVYDSFSEEYPILLGTLYVNVIRGEESYLFEYDESWLKNHEYFISLDPELPTYQGRLYPEGKNIFGLFADASPDCWGRLLMKKNGETRG